MGRTFEAWWRLVEAAAISERSVRHGVTHSVDPNEEFVRGLNTGGFIFHRVVVCVLTALLAAMGDQWLKAGTVMRGNSHCPFPGLRGPDSSPGRRWPQRTATVFGLAMLAIYIDWNAWWLGHGRLAPALPKAGYRTTRAHHWHHS